MIAIIDADELCYKIGFSAQHTWYKIINEANIEVAVLASSKEAKEYIGDVESLRIEKELRVLPVELAIRNLKAIIKSILLATGAKEYIFCMSGTSNFRFNIATIQEYKGNRSPENKPVHYGSIKEYLITNYIVNIYEDYEADDLLAIFYNEYDPKREGKAVIVTQDKDLLQVPGWFLNLGTEKHLEYGTEGTLFQITEQLGLFNFYSQLISGDSTDNIPGIYQITGSKNSKQYHNTLKKHTDNYPEFSEEDLYAYVQQLYKNLLGAKDTEDLDCLLWEIGNLIYMKRSFEDIGWKIPFLMY